MAEKPAPTKCHLIYTVPGPKKRQEGSGDGGKEEENGDDGQEELSAAEKVKESRRDADVCFPGDALELRFVRSMCVVTVCCSTPSVSHGIAATNEAQGGSRGEGLYQTLVLQ
jgi:hypothetical protein